MNTDTIEAAKFARLCQMTQGDYQAFLYDCDGTLADNMQAHKESYVYVASGAGTEIDPAIVDEFAGLPIPAVVEKINERYGSTFDPFEFERRKSDVFHSHFVKQTRPIQFVVDHLKASAGKYRIAVVSGGARNTVQETLEVLGIAHLVEVLVCAGETARAKPSPDPFLAAAAYFGLAPEACLVFEDGQAGVTAAEAAGMKWIRIDKIKGEDGL